MGMQISQQERLIGIHEVLARVDMGKTKLYADVKDGKFPKPIKRGTRSSWIESEIQAYVDETIRKARGEPAKLDDDIL